MRLTLTIHNQFGILLLAMKGTNKLRITPLWKRTTVLFIAHSGVFYFFGAHTMNKPLLARVCLSCETAFDAIRINQKFCSVKCRSSYRSRNAITKWFTRQCPICETKFSTNRPSQKFCTRKCSQVFHKKKYHEIKSLKEWDIFLRDGFKCRYCGKTADDARLRIDHIYPISKGGKSEFGNLITVCDPCNGVKKDKIMPMQMMFAFWDKADGAFTYEEARQIWRKEHKQRLNSNK